MLLSNSIFYPMLVFLFLQKEIEAHPLFLVHTPLNPLNKTPSLPRISMDLTILHKTSTSPPFLHPLHTSSE